MTHLTLTNSSHIGWWISFIFHTWLIQTIALGKKFFFIHFLPLGCPPKKKFNFWSNSLILIKFGSKLDWCYPKIWFTPITSGVDVWMRQLILRRFGANSLHMISQEYTGINKKFGIRFFLAKGWGRRWSLPQMSVFELIDQFSLNLALLLLTYIGMDWYLIRNTPNSNFIW